MSFGAIERKLKTPEAIIAGLAAKQHRVVARRQLLALGIGSEAIRHRVETSRLHVQHRGVYSVGTRELDRLGRWMAAVLAAGEDAVVSHISGAEHLGLLHSAPGRCT